MEIKITLNGTERTIAKHQLFALAARGSIGADTPIHVDGKPFLAGQVKGITFGQRQETGEQTSVPTPVAPPVVSAPAAPSIVSASSAPPTMKITLNGAEQTITQEQLNDLAARGIIGPNTVVTVNGKQFYAGQAKGIVFGQPLPPTIHSPTDGFSWDSSATPLGDLSSLGTSTGSLDGVNWESSARPSGGTSGSSSWSFSQISMKQVKYFIGGVLLLVIGIWCVIGGTNKLRHSHASLSWSTCDGIIDHTEIESSQGRKGTQYKPVIRYNYVVDDKTYTGNEYLYCPSYSRRFLLLGGRSPRE